GVEQDWRTTDVKHWIAGDRLQIARFGHPHAAIARIHDSGGRLDREPAIAFDRDVQGMIGAYQLAWSTGEIRFARRCKCDGFQRDLRNETFELHLLGAEACTGGIGDVAGDRFESSVKRKLPRERDVETRL